MSPAPRFLSVDDILTLHAIAIEDQGGDPTLRDKALLESAVAMPAQQFGQQYLHAEPVILQLAAGTMDKPAFTDWARKHMHQ